MLPTAYEAGEIFRLYTEENIVTVPNFMHILPVTNCIRPYLHRCPPKGILNTDYIPEVSLESLESMEPVVTLMKRTFGKSPHKPWHINYRHGGTLPTGMHKDYRSTAGNPFTTVILPMTEMGTPDRVGINFVYKGATYCPVLLPGDMIILRGDVEHGTEENRGKMQPRLSLDLRFR